MPFKKAFKLKTLISVSDSESVKCVGNLGLNFYISRKICLRQGLLFILSLLLKVMTLRFLLENLMLITSHAVDKSWQ